MNKTSRKSTKITTPKVSKAKNKKVSPKNSLPSQIKIFDTTYNVIYVDTSVSDVDNAKRTPLFGQIDYFDATIKIYSNRPEHLIWNTIWHEIVHGILEKIGLSDLNNNEGAVDILATGFSTVLKDNFKIELI